MAEEQIPFPDWMSLPGSTPPALPHLCPLSFSATFLSPKYADMLSIRTSWAHENGFYDFVLFWFITAPVYMLFSFVFSSYETTVCRAGRYGKNNISRFFSWQNNDLDFMTILQFFTSVRSILQVTANSGPQFCLQTYGWLIQYLVRGSLEWFC